MDEQLCWDCGSTVESLRAEGSGEGFVRRARSKGDGLPRLAAVGVCPTCNTIWERTLTSSALATAPEIRASADARRSTFWRWKPARSVSMKAD